MPNVRLNRLIDSSLRLIYGSYRIRCYHPPMYAPRAH